MIFAWKLQGTLPNDATLLSLFPHMHLRGKRFEYDIVRPDGSIDTLLRVNYHFHWQLSYRLAEPRLLKAGTKLRAVAWYDNSRNNPHNPDPEATVTWGDQTYQEMMVGFFDVAVPAKDGQGAVSSFADTKIVWAGVSDRARASAARQRLLSEESIPPCRAALGWTAGAAVPTCCLC